MSIRIAHVNVARNYRGGERQTELLIRELFKHGVRQVLVARKNRPLSKRFGDLDLEIRAVSGNPLSVARATAGVDIVHVHEGRSVYGAYLRELISGTPYIVTRRVDNPIRSHWLAHRAYRRAVYVAAVAPQVADVVRRYDPLIRLRVIHSSASGLSVDAAESAAIRRRWPGKFVVGHVGALDDDQKCQTQIIEVARELERSHADVQFVLVGGGDDEIMLHEKARGLGNVAFTGFVDNVADYLAAFDLFILPSRREGIGSILLDAMAQKLPIVASRVGGVPEIVHDGENGILIDPERPDQLRAAILRLRAARQLGAELGERGYAIATQYTPDVMAKKYLELYRSALEARC